MEKVIVTIDADANVKVEVKGVLGSGCKSLTEDLEKSLGSVSTEKKTAEYHRTPRVGASRRATQ